MTLDINNAEDLHTLSGQVCMIAKTAGEKILEIYGSEFSVEQKEDKSPLTAADMASHHTIVDGLSDLDIDFPILSEESDGELSFEERSSWKTYWLVDPLDGTREFIKRNGEFTVNIALIHEHKVILGVVYVPVSGNCYFASIGNGTACENNGNITSLSTRKTHGSNLVLAGSRSHGNEQQQAFMAKVGDAEIMAVGSSLKFCLVAEGKVDLYPRFGPTSEWDTAAAQCLVEQAGGRVTDMELNPLEYNRKESILNPYFLVIADPDYDWKSYL